jgi:hypothetical protein
MPYSATCWLLRQQKWRRSQQRALKRNPDRAARLSETASLCGVGDNDRLTDEGVLHCGIEKELGDVRARS